MMNAEGQLEDDGIDESTEPSNASYGSSESAGNQEDYELVKLLTETFNLPKDLCEDPEIFREFFSMDTWNTLSDDIQNTLASNLLPTFPDHDDYEKQRTIQMLFNNEIERFGQTPLNTFQANLEDGNFRPDILKLNKSLKRANEREQRYQECERVSRLAKDLHSSRTELLKLAYSQPAGGITKLRSVGAVPKLSSSAAANRAKKRYFQEITSITEELGVSAQFSDDENYPEGPSPSLTTKQKMTISGLVDANLSPGSELRIVSTMNSPINDHEHLLQLGNTSAGSDEYYRQLMQNFKKRKQIEPDHPELEIEEIKLKDILSRAQLPSSSKKSTYLPKKSEIKIKQEPTSNLTLSNISHFNNHSLQNSQNSQNTQIRLLKPQQKLLVPKNKLACQINVQQRPLGGSNSETDEEDWIKANIIKVEPRNEANSIIIKTEQPKPPEKVIKMVQVAKKRPNTSGMVTVQSKKIALDSEYMKTIIVRDQKPSNYQTKPATISDLQGVDMMQIPVDLDSSAKTAETHACYLSLIRDIFCSTQDHRMKIEDLRKKVVQWLGNPVTACNEWFHQSSNWLALLTSVVQFLSGEFLEQPEDYVPYLEYKAPLAIYQWIGAGRDSDNHLLPLCNYWLSRREDMGIKNFKLDMKNKVPMCESEDFVQPERPISPPSTNCSSEWRVGRTTDFDRTYFQQQERKRYEHPHLSFTYKQHNYESVVGPVKGIYTQVPGVSKARDHNTLVADRPNFVTILALVRDATARLPNGEGTRADICELLKSSQYISPTAPEAVLQSIVSGALDRMHTELDPCVKYDTKRKMWIYLHRNRTEDEFEKIHLQQQGMTKQKKQPILKKIKGPKSRDDSDEISPTTSSSSRSSQPSAQMIPNLSLSPLSTKTNIVTKSAQIIVKSFPQRIINAQKTQTIPALASFETKNKLMQSSPPPLVTKMIPKKIISLQSNMLEPFDVEASLDAHTTPILVKNQHNVVDNKMPKLTLKNMKLAPPMKVSLLQGSHQSILINTSRAQSPSVATYKKVLGKPVIISHSQAPPLVSQSSPISSTGQTYVPYLTTSTSQHNQSISTAASGTFAPKLVKSTDKPVLQQKNFVRINTQGGKVSPMQPKLILTSAALQQKMMGTVSSANKIPNQLLSQQKQIFQSTLVQQQKNKSMAGTIQKMPALALTSNTQSSPQILHSIKTLPGKNATLVMKSQVVKSQANQEIAPPLVSVSNVTSTIGNVTSSGVTLQGAKLIRPNQGGNIQVIASNVQTRTTSHQPLVAKVLTSTGQTQLISLDSLLQKPGTTFKLANAKPGQTGIIQLAGNQGSGQITQYAVVSKGGKNMLSVSPGMPRLITTLANTTNNTKTIDTLSVATTTSSGNVVLNNPQQPGQQIKILQSAAPITTNQLMNAKLINVQGLGGKGIKTAGGIKMLSTQNYIANIGGKQMLITGKPPVAGGGANQGIMLQTTTASNGSNTFILNSQGQPMKVQGNILTQGNFISQGNAGQTQTVMLGNQLVKVQSLSQIQQQQIQKVVGLNTSNTLTSNVNTGTMTGSNTLVLQSGQTIKVQQPNQGGIRPQQIILGSAALKNMLKNNSQVGQQTGQRMMLTTAGTQPGQLGQLMTQQIIVPANFQGNTLNIKTLQGLKMIPLQQGTSTDRVFARLLTTKPQTATASPTNSTNQSTPTSTITSAEKE